MSSQYSILWLLKNFLHFLFVIPYYCDFSWRLMKWASAAALEIVTAFLNLH